MDFSINLSFNVYISHWNLNFKKESDKWLYEKVTAIYKKTFVRLFFFWTIVSTIFLIIFQYNFLTNDFQRLFLVLLNILVCFLLYVFTKCLKTGLLLDILCSCIFLLINVIMIEVNIPNIIHLVR